MTQEPATVSTSALLPTRNRGRFWRSVILSLVLLLSGAAIGSGLTLLVLVRGLQFRIHHPEMFADRATERLQRFLDLDDKQSRQVRGILHDHQEKIQAIRRDCQPRFEHQVELIRADVSAVLTPEQARKWESWLDQKRKLWLPPPPATSPAR